MDRIKGIDGLRALAALSVFFFHAKMFGLIGGDLGVDLFFVISGFVITRSLKAEYDAGRINIAAFYFRRFLRLWPALIAMVAVFYYLSGFGMKEWLPAIFYIANFTRMTEHPYPAALGHTWSLAVEEQFYLVWPFLLLFFLRTQKPIRAMLFVIAAVCLWRVYLYWINAGYWRIYNGPDMRLDQLLLGACVAFCSVSTLKRLGRLWPIAVAVLAYAMFHEDRDAPYEFVWRMQGISVASAILIAKAASDHGGWLTKMLEFKPLAGLGVISYAFYLWHYPILYFYIFDYGKIACLGATILFAWGSWILVERPIRNNRAKMMASLSRKSLLSPT